MKTAVDERWVRVRYVYLTPDLEVVGMEHDKGRQQIGDKPMDAAGNIRMRLDLEMNIRIDEDNDDEPFKVDVDHLVHLIGVRLTKCV